MNFFENWENRTIIIRKANFSLNSAKMIEWWKNYYNRYLLNEFSVLTKIGTGLPIFEVRDRD